MNYHYSNENERDQCACCCNQILYVTITSLISILFATGVGLLFGFGLLGNVTLLVSIVLGIALLFLVFVLISTIVSGINEKKTQLSKCLCRYRKGLLIGSIGSIILALAAFATSAFIASIIIISLLALAFAVLIITGIFTIRCVCKEKC